MLVIPLRVFCFLFFFAPRAPLSPPLFAVGVCSPLVVRRQIEEADLGLSLPLAALERCDRGEYQYALVYV